MGSEVLIYGYGTVCLFMLAFNLIYRAYLRSENRRSERRQGQIASIAAPGANCAVEGKPLPDGHSKLLMRRLSYVNSLVAFDAYLRGLPAEAAEAYLQSISSIFAGLARLYLKKDEMQGAYFCHFIAGWGSSLQNERERLRPFLYQYGQRKSLYSRVNSLKGFCALGDQEGLLQVLSGQKWTFQENISIHQKIIVEALLTFRGDTKAFAENIWARFSDFAMPIQRALLDYMRFSSDAHKDRMLEIMLDETLDRELRFSAIRYFGRYPDERARKSLLQFLSAGSQDQWEYMAISATALAKYPGEDTIHALVTAMHNPNWYVRHNSAESLTKLGFTYEDLLGASAAEDRYAREMLSYRLESKRLQENPKKELRPV